jgi:hypothetical protein
VLDGYVTQVSEFQAAGKVTAEQATGLTALAGQITSNLSHWLE